MPNPPRDYNRSSELFVRPSSHDSAPRRLGFSIATEIRGGAAIHPRGRLCSFSRSRGEICENVVVILECLVALEAGLERRGIGERLASSNWTYFQPPVEAYWAESLTMNCTPFFGVAGHERLVAAE